MRATKEIVTAAGLMVPLCEACGLDPTCTRRIEIVCETDNIVHITAELYGTTNLEEFGWKTFFGAAAEPPRGIKDFDVGWL